MKDLFYFIYTSSLMVKQLDQRVTIIYINYYMENIVFKCEFCGRDDFGNKNACNSHRGKCKQNPNVKQTEPSEKWYEARKHLKKYNLQSGTCKFCGRKSTSKSGLSFHEKYCKDNPDRESTENLSHKHSEERKNKILGCGVDLMKFGWQKKVEIKTSLTRRQIQSTIKHFYDFFEKKSFQRDLR